MKKILVFSIFLSVVFASADITSGLRVRSAGHHLSRRSVPVDPDREFERRQHEITAALKNAEGLKKICHPRDTSCSKSTTVSVPDKIRARSDHMEEVHVDHPDDPVHVHAEVPVIHTDEVRFVPEIMEEVDVPDAEAKMDHHDNHTHESVTIKALPQDSLTQEAHVEPVGQKDHSATHNHSLTHENRVLTQENRILTQNSGSLPQENRTLPQENRTLTQENRTLTQENRTLPQENRTLPQENRTLTQENRTLAQENRTLPQENRTLANETRNLTHQNMTLNATRKPAETSGKPENIMRPVPVPTIPPKIPKDANDRSDANEIVIDEAGSGSPEKKKPSGFSIINLFSSFFRGG